MKLRDVNKLRALFALKGIHKQVDIANEIFLSENSVVNLFKGNRVNTSTARRIASYLGVEVEELFETESPKVLALALELA